jgi:hypothetical protein
MGIGNHDRAFEKATFFDPSGSCHLAIAIQSEPAGKALEIVGQLATRQNGRNPRPHRTLSNLQLSLTGDDRGMADFDALHIGDAVKGTCYAIKGNPQIPSAWPVLSQTEQRAKDADSQCEEKVR